MNFFQTTTNAQAELKTLNKDLSDFGLHPFDWVLIKNSQKEIKIQHKIEHDFYFIGRTISKNGKKKWSSIQLASL